MTSPPHSPARPAGALAALAFLLNAAACETAPPADAAPQVAADRYFDADTAYFRRDFASGSVASALSQIVANRPGAAAALEAALAMENDEALTARLGPLVVREHIVDYDYGAAALAADRLGLTAALNPVQRAYGAFPAPRAEADTNVIEVPYSDGKIPARINGVDVTVVFDTGAPNIGLQTELVERLGLTVDRSVSRTSRVPAYGLEFPVYAALIDEFQIGGLTIFNAPANFGDVPEDQRAAAEALREATGGAEVITGLDAIRPFVDVIAFDWDAGVIRITVEAGGPPPPTNYILNPGRAPVFKITAGARTTNLSFDSGAYGHLLGPETLDAAPRFGRRLYDRGDFQFTEALIGLTIEGAGPIALWASGRRFAEDPNLGVSGVLGVLNDGVLTLDLRSRHLSIAGYDPAEATYAFAPIEEEIDEDVLAFTRPAQ
ncbi:MAG: retropepsin-like aspartic protease [Pseudomonadota bacterium]